MPGLIDYIIESREVDQLTLVKADEILYYIDLRLDQDGDILEVVNLFHLKSKILDHLMQLEMRRVR